MNDNVVVHYEGWNEEDREFDSSRKRGHPITFKLTTIIKGWEEGVQLMAPGDVVRFWFPADLAYGEKPKEPGKKWRPWGNLVFEIELIDVLEPPPTPPDVAAPPPAAKRTSSGLSYLQLRPGNGGPHPGPSSVVKVHYSGWTTEGVLFDTSITRGLPATFKLDRIIPGWQEGVQHMTVGEKARFWIPGSLAYGDPVPGRPNYPHGRPLGTLVFEIELLEIVSP